MCLKYYNIRFQVYYKATTMFLKKVNFSRITKSLSLNFIQSFNKSLSNADSQLTQTSNTLFTKNNIQYQFSTSRERKHQPIPQNKITFEIQKAVTAQQLHQLFAIHHKSFNFIHRTVLLQKVTQRPFDQDQELVQKIIQEIKNNWKHDYPVPSQTNSRAIANTICYMGRKKKHHALDNQIAQIDFYQLANHLNPKQFVMTLNGLLKLDLLEKVYQMNPEFSLEKFITQNINQNFLPSLLVSMWFNLLKFEKSTQNINNFFASNLKNKNFKSNIVDYMQIVYCYVNSQGKRNVDLTYSVMTHPKELGDKSRIGAHQLSVLYDQLAKLKKIKDVYFSDEFNQLLQTCYLRVLNQKDIPLRNVANVFNYLIQYENPTSKTLQATFYKYYTVLKYEIELFQRHQGKRFRANVDSLSFVTLFNLLLEHYQKENTYLNEISYISLVYVQKILNHSFVTQYNERTFVRMLHGLQIAKKMIDQKNPDKKFQLNNYTKFGLQKEILKRDFNQVSHLGKLIGFVYNFDIRSKQVCQKLKILIESIPKQNQVYTSYQQRLQQKCILNKNCKNCQNCFSN